MRQRANNFSDMVISYSLHARQRSVEQAASEANTSDSISRPWSMLLLFPQRDYSQSPVFSSVDAT